MPTLFVASGGSNTAPYDTWAKAATSHATAFAAATGTGDIVVTQYDAVPSADAELAADTTFTFAGHITWISASNDGGSAYTPTAMSTGNWLGNSTTFRSVTLAGAFRVLIYGITLRTAGSTVDSLTLGSTAGSHYEFDSCYFWNGNTSASSAINCGSGTRLSQRYTNCTFRFGATGQGLCIGGAFLEFEGGGVSNAGSAPTTLFKALGLTGASLVRAVGFDVSHVGAGTLVGNMSTSCSADFLFERCKLGSGMTVLATQTVTNKASVRVRVHDCDSGDTHNLGGYYDAFGQVESNTTIFRTAGNNGGQSWKITTTANCSFYTPFVTPWMRFYNAATSAITPRFEVVRDGSATAYKNDELWAEFMAKVTAGSTQATLSSDRKVLGAANANQSSSALGAGDWTGENATAWFGKLDSGSAITPAEVGDISGRICVGVASASDIYVCPEPLTT